MRLPSLSTIEHPSAAPAVAATGGPRPAWLFRVASHSKWGAGHVSRCRALGRALIRDVPVTMVLDRGGEHWREALEADGFAVRQEGESLPGPWAGSVIDGYHFAAADAERLKRISPPVVAIDDFLEPPRGADLAVTPMAPEGETTNGVPALRGPRYALIDERFCDLPKRAARERAEHVLVSLGMRDAPGATSLALRALALAADGGFAPHVSIAIGSRAEHLDSVVGLAATLGGRAELRVDEVDVPALMAGADMAIVGGGVALIECMATGVPALAIETADNQALNIAGALRLGAAVAAGAVGELAPQQLAAAIEALGGNGAHRQALSDAGRVAVDGRGSDRVARALLALSARMHAPDGAHA